MPKLASLKTCTGCMACVDSCKFDSLKLSYSINGFIIPKVDSNKCVECGKCEIVCPILNKETSKNELSNAKAYGAWSINDKIREKSTSGGIFGQIAFDFITKNKGYVIGASLIQNSVKHIVISHVPDIQKLQGSKYLQSETNGIYLKTLELLQKGEHVLFSGTPCQIQGLYSYIRNRNNYENLFTIEVVCHGVPSTSLYKYNIEKNNVDKVISFRDKVDGWHKGSAAMTYILRGGKKIRLKPKNHDFFLNSFGRDLSLRLSCYNCTFSTLPRVSDITLADYWGIKDWENEWEKGVSLVIVNNEKGRQLLNNPNIVKHPTEWDKCLPKNPRIYNCKNLHSLLSYSNRLNFILKTFPYSVNYFLLSARISNKNLIWLPYKILVKIIGAIVKFYNRRTLNKMLTKLKS
ncbi:MAG: Coenzyme F420 hydrogenase/dehydrogenase, beta subunit C-terminal domain [Bacteroidales bacterium]|nr:Coenzyme F420 hydrogenase/dehydrogenase, beta subunit C-terminal domain [Bacteroidales bacterium]